MKTCIVCNNQASGTRIREDVEAAFCNRHLPREGITITIRC
ncbi:MAG: hypothetical protein QT00_C0002G0060 [archaeon GW2011_AR5]|nr:MAG: hypothetical protein QT00_C0002G0060 [archaeon GW2011_AR5]